MQIEVSSEQFERLINIVGEELEKKKRDTECFLFRLYLRLIMQAQEQGINICKNVLSVEATEQI